MRTAGKKALSLALVAAQMVFGALPAAIMAADYESAQLTIDSKTFSLRDSHRDTGWSWDADEATLTLDSRYSSTSQNITFDPYPTATTVTLKVPESVEVSTILVGRSTDACGDFKVETADNATLTLKRLQTSGALEIEGGTVNATANTNYSGIRADKGVTITDASMTVSGDYGIRSDNGSVTISGGTVDATGKDGSGIFAKNDITIEQGTLNLTSDDSNALYGDRIVINGGTVTATGKNGAFSRAPEFGAGYAYQVTAGDSPDTARIVSKPTDSTFTGSKYVKIEPVGSEPPIPPIVPGDDNDDDNDSDSSSKPIVTIMSAIQPDWPTIGSVTGKTAGTSTQQTFTVTDSLVKAALEKAQTDANAQNRTAYGVGAKLALDTPAAAGLTVTTERAALNRLVSEKAKQFEITGTPITIALDTKALAELQKQGDGNVTITAKPTTVKDVRNAYDITLTTVKDGKTVRITSLGAGTAALSIPCTPAKDEAAGGFYAVYVDDNGKVNRIADSAYDANSGGVMFSTNHFSVYGVGYTAPSAKFTDISSHWAKESIDYVAGRGLLSGTTETTFAPDTAMTRGMLVTALGRLANVDTKAYTTNRFTDVYADSVFRPYIEWAYSKGIVQGIDDSQFAPDRVITREEIAAILFHYAKSTGYTLPVARTATAYADASSIGSAYETAVTAVQQAGIMMGGRNNKFNPKSNTTRAEASAMLYRYVKLTIDPAAAQGWAKNDAGQYLYYKDGTAVTDTQTIDGVKYFFNTNGTLKTGWVQDGGNWMYYSGNKLLTGWWDIGANGNHKRYYFDIYGNMVSGKWLQIDGKWYYFYADGTLAVSTKIDEHEVDENGVRKTK